MNELLQQLTIEQKVDLLSGLHSWWTRGQEQPYVPQIMMTDGPCGLRKQSATADNINDSSIATCYPTACSLANSWDRDLAFSVGSAIGAEARAEQVSIVLGPGVNIKRNPLCGRNFEYYSEDPFLTGRLADKWIEGIQSQKVGACVKHFAVNSQETRRSTIDTLVDERALREIYLSAFEYITLNSKPCSIMAAYNKLNGVSCAQNKRLLTDILRGEWGYEGLVMSDWGAAYNIVECIRNGMDLEMPDGLGLSKKALLEAVKNGELDVSDIDRAVANVLKLVFARKKDITEKAVVDLAEQHLLAKETATECATLLKNNLNVLPLKPEQKVLVVGELAKNMRFQGAGSSHIHVSPTPNLLDTLRLNNIDVGYARGYDASTDEINSELIEQACNSAKDYDIIVFCGGLTDIYESEGYDREHLDMPLAQSHLISKLTKLGKKTVFVSFGGSPYIIPYVDEIDAILNMYLCGQGAGEATYELLYGIKNPCGKLSETWPKKLSSVPCYNFFNRKIRSSEHRESIFVGYRYYDTFDVPTLFDFGYGLSYTQFEYSDFTVNKNNVYNYTVSVKVKNIGSTSGKEVVQLYIANPRQDIIRAKRELKGFAKTDLLEPNEEQEIIFTLDKRSFAFYDVTKSDYVVPSGKYTLQIGGGLKQIKATKVITVSGETIPSMQADYPSYFEQNGDTFFIPEDEFVKLLGRPLIEDGEFHKGEFTLSNTLYDMRANRFIRFITNIVIKQTIKSMGMSKHNPAVKMAISGTLETPLINATAMSQGVFKRKFCQALVYIANGKFFKGIGHLLSKEK
ncbi:MAG: glycoside hydrolase family 3 C-terminal domain-containing protein [Clostridia bacterium]